MRLMLGRRLLHPPGYAEQGCLLVSYWLPLLDHCYIVCHDGNSEAAIAETQLLAFALRQAGDLALQLVGDREAFMLIQGGRTVRKRGNWHAHVFIVKRRWQKAWVYLILGLRSLALVFVPAPRPTPGTIKTTRGTS